jgi:hypothetical protein
MSERVIVVKAWNKKTVPTQIMNFSFAKKDQSNTKWIHDASEFTKYKKYSVTLKVMNSEK